jgi:hypothetical protein
MGSMKNQFAAIAASATEISAGLNPLNHATKAIAGKKEINGRAVGPTDGVSASLASIAAATLAAAAP